MVHVLAFGMNENPGGMESFIMSYYRRFDREQVQLDFLTNCPTIAYEDEIQTLGGRVYKICARSKNLRLYRKQLGAFFEAHAAEYEAIWMNTCSLANIDYLKMAKAYGIPRRIIHSHNSQNMDNPLRGLLHRKNRRVISRYATDFWACSRTAGEFFYSPAILASDRYREIRNAIDCTRFTYDEAARQAVRAEYGLTDKTVIGHVGRLHFQKNQRFLLDVFRHLYAAEPNARLLVIGQGEDEAMLKEKTHALGLDDAVLFLGVRDDVPRLMQAMDAFALPSLFEGLPVVLVETQAAGLPAVAADTISREAKITDRLTYLPLDAGAEVWAQALLDAAHTPRADRRAPIAAAGYDIDTQAALLQALLTDTQEDAV